MMIFHKEKYIQDARKYLQNKYPMFSANTADYICGFSDSIEIIQWFLHSYSVTKHGMDLAATEGHLHLVQWLHANQRDIAKRCPPFADPAAELQGHREAVCTTDAMDWAAKNGHLHVVQWLHENRFEGCTTFATDGDIAKRCPSFANQMCITYAMNYAAENGHLDVVKWLHEIEQKDVLQMQWIGLTLMG